jgi:hypothetical protein
VLWRSGKGWRRKSKLEVGIWLMDDRMGKRQAGLRDVTEIVGVRSEEFDDRGKVARDRLDTLWR